MPKRENWNDKHSQAVMYVNPAHLAHLAGATHTDRKWIRAPDEHKPSENVYV